MALSFKKFVKGIFVQNDSDRTKEVGLTVDNAASSGTNTNLVAKQTLSRTLELPDVSGVLVEKDAAQTLTNKTIDGDNNTLQDVSITSLKTELADANKFIARDVSGQVVSANTVPNGTVVGTSDSQSLTNKTINADLNTITNIEDADIKVGAAIDAAKIHDGSVSNTEFGYLNGVTSSIQTQLNDKAEISGATDNRLVKTDGATDIQQTGITVDDSNNVTGVNDLTVEGNLTVNGTTTTVNTATLDVEDKNITVNFNGTDVTAEGAGLTVDRTGTSGSLVYEDALASKWKAGALGSEIEVANVSSSQTLTNKNLKSNTNLLTGAKSNSFERETGNQQIVSIPDVASSDTFVTQAFSQTITNKDIDGGTASNTSRLTVPQNTLTNLLGLTRKEATVVYANDTDKLYVDDGSTLKEIGSGSGTKNFISNGDAEANTLGWATYADAAAPRPVDGTGGSASITWTRSTSSPLEGQGSFLFTKDAVNRQGQGASYNFPIDQAYKARVLTIKMDYQVVSGTFVAGTNTTDSDLIVYMYDVTNSQLIEPSSIKFLSNSTSLSDQFEASFQTSATGSNFRLIIHCASTSASAYVVKFDNIQVSPSEYVYGTPITDWTSYTPTGSFTTNTTYSGFWRRVGKNLEAKIRMSFAGATNATTLSSITLPSGLSIDTAIVASSNAYIGSGVLVDTTVNGYPLTVLPNGTGAVVPLVHNASTTYALTNNITNTAPFSIGSGDFIDFDFSVPIVGWSSSVQTSDQTDTRVVAEGLTTAAGQAVANTATALINLNSLVFSTHGGSDFTVGKRINIIVPGYYDLKGQVSLASTGAGRIIVNIKRNGSFIFQALTAGISGVNESSLATGIIFLNSGDYIELETINETGATATVVNGSGSTFLYATRISGPSAIAASESVNMRATQSSGQSIPNSTLTTVVFNNKSYDSHNAYNSGTGEFRAPISGIYRVSASIMGSFSAGTSTLDSYIYVNGILTSLQPFTIQATLSANWPWFINDELRLNAGDVVTYRVTQNTGSSRTLSTAPEYNRLTISRIGN
jgi:hypothetical protein